MKNPARRRLGSMLIATTISLLFAPATGLADTEPNNSIVQAEGPVSAGQTISGSLSGPADDDWYFVYIAGQRQIRISASLPERSPGSPCAEALFLNSDGGPGSRQSLPFTYTTPPGTRRYYLRVVSDSAECQGSYSLRIDPPDAVVSGPPLDVPQGVAEPNESASQAVGPLRGGLTYAGALETANDEDWFYFFVRPGTHQLDLSATNPALDRCRSEFEFDPDLSQPFVYLISEDGDELGTVGPNPNQVEHIRTTLQGPAKLFVRVRHFGCAGANWRFRIDPVNSVSQTREGSSRTTAARTLPFELTLRAARRRISRRSLRLRLVGRVVRPVSVSQTRGCRGGSVELRVRYAGRTLLRRLASIRRDCTYGRTLTVPTRGSARRARRLRINAEFSGNEVLAPAVRSIVVRTR